MSSSLRRIWILSKRNFKEILRDPIALAFNIGMPLVMEILFYLLFHKMTSQFEMRYLAPGIVVFSQSFIALFVGILLSIDRNSSFLTRLYVSKAKSYEFIFGYALSIVPVILMQSVLFFLVGGIIDPNIFGVGMLYGILLSLVTSLFFIGFGLLIGSLCNDKAVGGVASIVISLQSLLSGMWFPTEGLGSVMINIMNALPFRNATILIQNAMNGTINDVFKDFLLPLIIVLAYSIVIFVVAIIVFKKKMQSK